eukprot:symbB.v1.2.021211.t1/scaffold1822.1/size99790/6
MQEADDHLMADIQREDLERVLLPKMDGTLHLHNNQCFSLRWPLCLAPLDKETILGAQVSSHLGAYVGVARIMWRSYLSQMPKLPSFLENFQQYALKDSKKGALMAKGAAPSRELVRTGIENMLKEVLGLL